MVRFTIPTVNEVFPLKHPNCISKFLSKKHQCLAFLKLCSSIKHLYQIHAQVQVFGLQSDTFLLSELVRFCSLSSWKDVSYARTLLDTSVDSMPSSWNMLIRGYASSDSAMEAIWVFHEMRRRRIRPNNLTFPFLLKACAMCSLLKEGRQVHVEVFKYGLDCDVYVQNNLVHFYGSCKKIRDAQRLFDAMSERTVVSWNAIITACVDNFQLRESIRYFVKMIECGFEPDETTMVVLLSACAELGNLSLGMWVHSQVIARGLVLNLLLGTALVDMYAKCGGVDYGKVVFNRMDERNVWTWSAMIMGLAQHGYAHEALHFFSMMRNKSSIRPNYVTFLGVLCACSHAGLVEDGYRYFHEMEHKHKIKPTMIHYGAMVDILGRAGRLEEAYDFIRNMPVEPDPIVLRTLLSACSIHSNDGDGIGDEIQKKLLKMEPKRSGNFVIVANIYAEAGMWDKAAKV
ncbi:pentatricopeptide repeat-containing protein At2g36730, partial [Carica papaya]|uniref:pentatricopeptide repeat-containing protein At2g36730 n=1 Tax=Carica papaya TaxID=3649 RepID=UPI000B8CC1E0